MVFSAYSTYQEDVEQLGSSLLHSSVTTGICIPSTVSLLLPSPGSHSSCESSIRQEIINDIKSDFYALFPDGWSWKASIGCDVFKEGNDSFDGEEMFVSQPHCGLTSAGVVLLSDEKWGHEGLLDILATTYSKTKRETNSKKRVTIVDKCGMTESYEFQSRKEYWEFVSAVKKSKRHPVNITSHFTITQSEINGHADEFPLTTRFSIREAMLFYNHPRHEHLISVDLTDLKALAVSEDFSKPLDTLLCINDFSCNWKINSIGESTMPKSSPIASPNTFMSTLRYNSAKLAARSQSDSIILKGLQTNSDESGFLECSPSPCSMGVLASAEDVGGIVTLEVNMNIQSDCETSGRSNNRNVSIGIANVPLQYFLSNYTFGEKSSKSRDELSSNSISIDLSLPSRSHAAHLVIYSIEKLDPGYSTSSSSILERLNGHRTQRLPNVYCVVYAILKNDNKTSVCESSLDPIWKEEFWLNEKDGFSSIASVLIRVKDANAGHVRDPHLGQVELPIEVFVPSSDPALLRLPLAKTDKMASQQKDRSSSSVDEFLGLISLGVRLVKFTENVGSTDLPRESFGSQLTSLKPKVNFSKPFSTTKLWSFAPLEVPGNSDSSKEGASLMLARQMPGCLVSTEEVISTKKDRLTFKYTVKKISPSNVWFPYHIVSEMGCQNGNVVDSRWSDMTWADTGKCLECLLDFDFCTLGIRKDCSKPPLRIPWNKVSNVSAITSTSLSCTLLGTRLSDRMLSHEMEIVNEVERIEGSRVDEIFNKTVQFAKRLTPPQISESIKSKCFDRQMSVDERVTEDEIDVIIGPCDSAIMACIMEDRVRFRNIRDKLKNLFVFYQEFSKPDISESSVCILFIKSITLLEACVSELLCTKESSSNQVASNLRVRMYVHSLTMLTQAALSDFSALNNDNDNDAFLEHLEQACGADFYRDYKVDGLRDVEGEILKDRKESWLRILERWSKVGKSENGLHQEEEEIDVLDVINLLNDIKLACLHNVRFAIVANSHFEDPLSHVQTIINEHFDVVNVLLKMFLADDESLLRLQGQENKSAFIKFVILSDSHFSNEIRCSLSLLGYCCKPELRLMGSLSVNDIVHLYHRCLVSETRKWLHNTIKQSKNNRDVSKSAATTPWDIDDVGGKVISSLPETFRFQMNAYAGLLKNDELDPSFYESFMSREEVDHALQSAGLHEQVLRALCVSLLVLAQEFSLALQSKHWNIMSDETDADDSQNDNLMFLASMANDSYRMQTVHVAELLRIESVAEWSQDTQNLVKRIGDAFNEVIDKCIVHMCRVIFFDLIQILREFFSMWQKACGIKRNKRTISPAADAAPVSVIMSTLHDFLKDLCVRQEQIIFYETLLSCVDILVFRYLMFLMELQHFGSKIGQDQIEFICEDISEIKSVFCSFIEDRINCRIIGRLSLLSDMVCILTSSQSNDAFKDALLRLNDAHDSKNENDKDCCTEFIATILRLRLDVEGKYQVAKSILSKATASPSQSGRGAFPLSAKKKYISYSIIIDVYRAFSNIHGGDLQDCDGHSKNSRSKKLFAVSSNSKKMKKNNGLEMLRLLGLVDKARGQSKHDYSDELQQMSADDTTDSNMHVSGPSVSISDSRNTRSSFFSSSQFGGIPNSQSDLKPYSIIVDNIRVKNLKSKALIGKSNPYIVMCVGGMRLKTKVIWNESNASWTEPIIFKDIAMNLGSLGKLDIKVYDKERLARKTLLGAVTVPVDGVDINPIDSWFALQEGHLGSNGEVYVNIRAGKSI